MLDPDASMTCTATSVVQQADVDAGAITNTATANGEDAFANQLEPGTDESLIPRDRKPVLDRSKNADRTETVAGATITNAAEGTDPTGSPVESPADRVDPLPIPKPFDPVWKRFLPRTGLALMPMAVAALIGAVGGLGPLLLSRRREEAAIA